MASKFGLFFIGYDISAFVGPKISSSFFDTTGSNAIGYIGYSCGTCNRISTCS